MPDPPAAQRQLPTLASLQILDIEATTTAENHLRKARNWTSAKRSTVDAARLVVLVPNALKSNLGFRSAWVWLSFRSIGPSSRLRVKASSRRTNWRFGA